MELKKGQVFKRINKTTTAFTVGQYYPVRINEYGVPFILSDSGAPWYGEDIIDCRFELVEEPVPDPKADVEPVLINVECLMEHIVKNDLTKGELLAYLDGYMKGTRF